METPMTTFTRRRTPYGYTIVEYDDGLYLEGDALRALETALNNANVRFTVRDSGPGRYLVEFDHGEDPPFDLGVAEWGADASVEGALRYALGAHFGSWEDPVIKECPTCGPSDKPNCFVECVCECHGASEEDE